jgi:hypothetical protein
MMGIDNEIWIARVLFSENNKFKFLDKVLQNEV